MSSITDTTVQLDYVRRLSPLNPRQHTASDISMLAATIRARGLLHPLLLRACDDAIGWEVLAGGRRWRALQSLGDPTLAIAAKIFEGTEAEAREAALAEATTQRPLHPVEEFEAFRDLADAGFDHATIARDFGLTERHVKQRLALGRLSARVLALWRGGEITRELAEAFTAGTIEAQEAYLDKFHNIDDLSAYRVRKELRADILDGAAPVAKFLLAHDDRICAYSGAGGRLEESLFTEETLLLDAALARKTANRLLLAEAERVMEAEGWGGAAIPSANVLDDEYPDIDPDYTEEEEKRLDVIEDLRMSSDAARDDAALDAEQVQIERRAILRAVSMEDRATLGVRAELTHEGQVDIIRGVPLSCGGEAKENQDGESEERDDAPLRTTPTGDKKERKPAEPPAPEPAKIGKALKSVLDEAVNDALNAATAGNLNLALVFSTAALGCSYGRAGVGLSDQNGGYWRKDPKSSLLRSIRSERFEKALLECLKAPLADLSTAFAELVARSIDVSKDEHESALVLIGAASRLSDMRKKLAAAFDYQAYFETNPRDAAIEAIRRLDGDAYANDSARLKKYELALRAADLACAKSWLPDDFDKACGASDGAKAAKSKDKRSTAQAMRDAIVQDEAQRASGRAGPERAPETNRVRIETFIELNCFRGNDALDAGRVKASELYEAFVAFCEEHELPPIGMIKFGELIAEIGVEKKRLKNGVHYLNLRLKNSADDKQAAE